MREEERFIIIGSNSFSGASFVDYVFTENPRAEVIGISRSPEYRNCFLPYKKHGTNRFRFYQFDLNRGLREIINLVRENRPDYIVNFAAQGMVAQSWLAPEQWFQTNCMAIMNLVNSLTGESYLKRYVQISSPEVYGACRNVTEDDAKLKPSTPYAASKACGDLSIYPFFLTKGFPLAYTRATNVYGPYQQLYRIIPRTVVSIKKNVKIQLHGSGRAVKSYIHIRDVCDATLKITRDGRNGEMYHISPDYGGISVFDIVKKVCEMMDKRMQDCVEIVEERLGQDNIYLIDSSKIRQELGWNNTISIQDGIQEVIDWVNEYWDELRSWPLEYIHIP